MSRFKPANLAPVNLNGQADGDYIRNDDGIWKPKTLLNVQADILANNVGSGELSHSLFFDGLTTTGTGNRPTNNYKYITVGTGLTAESTALVYSGHNKAWNRESAVRIDWRNKIYIFIQINSWATSYASTNTEKWLYFGSATGDAAADPVSAGVGIRIDNLAVKGIVHNGTSLTVVDLGVTMGSYTIKNILITSDAGSVEWVVNDVSKGTTNSGPNVLSALYDSTARLYVANNEDETDARLILHSCKFVFGQ